MSYENLLSTISFKFFKCFWYDNLLLLLLKMIFFLPSSQDQLLLVTTCVVQHNKSGGRRVYIFLFVDRYLVRKYKTTDIAFGTHSATVTFQLLFFCQSTLSCFAGVGGEGKEGSFDTCNSGSLTSDRKCNGNKVQRIACSQLGFRLLSLFT